MKDSPSSVTIKWENIPELNILAHYRVYKRNPEGLITKAITLQPQLTFFDVFFDLIAYENVFVVAYSSVVSNDTVILPAISREDEGELHLYTMSIMIPNIVYGSLP